MTLSLDLINLLEWLTELRETLDLHVFINYKLYYKGYRWTDRWKRCIMQGMWTQPFHCGLFTHQQPPRMFSCLESLQLPYFWVFMEAPLHRVDWLHHWPLEMNSTLNFSLLPRDFGVGLKFPPSNYALAFLENSLHPEAI